MDVYTCPKGHQSTESDFCSECGARIQAAPTASAPAASTPRASGEVCPDCSTPRVADGSNFCEVCGYNFVTGAHGEVPVDAPPAAAPVAVPLVASAPVAPQPVATAPPDAPPVAPVAADAAATRWAVVVEVDPSLREAGSPEPPVGVGPFTINLDKQSSLIGRKSDSRAIFPEISLNFDDAVSHRHALLAQADDGALTLRDIGAANGTRLNGKDVAAMVDVLLQDGDQITLGHWTRITVKAVH